MSKRNRLRAAAPLRSGFVAEARKWGIAPSRQVARRAFGVAAKRIVRPTKAVGA